MRDYSRIRDPFVWIAIALKNRPTEVVGCIFIGILALLVYLIGTFQILLPVLVQDSSTLVRFLSFLTPTWFFLGVISNLILLKMRTSSIKGHILNDPVLKLPPPRVVPHGMEAGPMMDQEIRERTKLIGEHFKARPFGEDEAWHICSVCEVFVPPRTWHCDICKTCILRRDHHCILTMGCIGEGNHANFLGLLLYLALGASMATVVSFHYYLNYEGVAWWMLMIKAFVPFYTLFFDFSLFMMLTGICFIGEWIAWGVFLFYFWISLRGQTSADWSRGISRHKPGGRVVSYENLESMVGPSPLFRILWPFHKVVHPSVSSGNNKEKGGHKTSYHSSCDDVSLSLC